MPQPTIEKRLSRRFIVMSHDALLVDALRAETPADWELVTTDDLAALGDWHDLILYRFVLLDLDDQARFDPLDVIRTIRTEHMLQVPVFCFGGDSAFRDDMRQARADRFFERDQIAAMLPQFFKQYSWGR